MMKEPAWVMKMMSTYGDLEDVDNQEVTRRYYKDKNSNIVQQEIKYTTIFVNLFCYCHKIDDHDNQRPSHPSLEETWETYRWENRVFVFFCPSPRSTHAMRFAICSGTRCSLMVRQSPQSTVFTANSPLT